MRKRTFSHGLDLRAREWALTDLRDKLELVLSEAQDGTGMDDLRCTIKSALCDAFACDRDDAQEAVEAIQRAMPAQSVAAITEAIESAMERVADALNDVSARCDREDTLERARMDYEYEHSRLGFGRAG